ncbi:MAG: response regulator transcription factor [Phycisphaerales bacterium]|jgi:DNA-binding NarL/FixJ family response regulator|nr:response regulator transcription factor [Phycisphaerales bacterium]
MRRTDKEHPVSDKQDAKSPKKVLIVDDHELMRLALSQLIGNEPDLVVCAEAEDVAGALKAIEQSKPDIAMVDISLKQSHGIELIKDIQIRWPDLPVLVLTMHDESFYAERVLRAGAKGYLTKAEVSSKVIEGIRKVLNGEVYISDAMASKVLTKLVGQKNGQLAFPIDTLSDREFEVFEMIGQGMQSKDIAQQLHLSKKTVDAHREHIKKKLGLETATDVLMYAVQWAQFERET